MCGITGYWSKDHSDSSETMHRRVGTMAETIKHRGPDGSGTWVDPKAGIALGHRRLAILDLSPSGHQPMTSPDGRLILTFNGEIYNHLELRGKLESDGQSIQWRGHSDTETLLHAFMVWGIRGTLQAATGMFALGLWDTETRRLTLARDRFGEKPLYYGLAGDVFAFGSELKPLRGLPSFDPDLDPDAISLFLRFGYVPTPRSIYRGIHKLEPGTIKTFRDPLDPGTSKPYWSLEDAIVHGQANPFQGDSREAQLEFERLFSESVKKQLIADVPVGALLSGGIDSTLVCAHAQRHLNSPLQTFTVGFPGTLHDETPYARDIATKLGTNHHELTISESELLDFVPTLPTIYDEPFADSSQIPTCAVTRFARQHVTVALSGDGADEAFGGYNRYIYAPALWKRLSKIPHGARSALGATLAGVSPRVIDKLFGRFAATVGVGLPGIKIHKLGVRLKNCRSEQDLYISLATEWQRSDALTPAGSNATCSAETPSSTLSSMDFSSRMMAIDSLTYLPDDILTKVDRASMHSSLETRAPFLDHRLAEFAWTLPHSMKIENRRGKVVMRNSVRSDSRDLAAERPKKGFSVPLDDWLRGPLRDWAESSLEATHLEGVLGSDAAPVQRAWKQLQSGHSSLCYRIWTALTIATWSQSTSS